MTTWEDPDFLSVAVVVGVFATGMLFSGVPDWLQGLWRQYKRRQRHRRINAIIKELQEDLFKLECDVWLLEAKPKRPKLKVVQKNQERKDPPSRWEFHNEH